jgi:putative heme iron utilization protein
MTNDAHATPTIAQQPLFDVNIDTPTHAERARTMVAQLGTGTLCTVAAEPAGYPYGSFVTVAFEQGHPVFLISELAEHTKNLRKDARASLLMAEGGADDPLANARVTLVGDCTLVADPDAARTVYLQRHPNAGYYEDFKDFNFWQLKVAAVRYIGGYGRMSWVECSDWAAAEADPLAPFASGILQHMNQDHADTMVLYCRSFSKAADTSSARMTGVDRYGFEMSATTENGPRPIRLAFSRSVSSAEAVRAELVEMARKARSVDQSKGQSPA